MYELSVMASLCGLCSTTSPHLMSSAAAAAASSGLSNATKQISFAKHQHQHQHQQQLQLLSGRWVRHHKSSRTSSAVNCRSQVSTSEEASSSSSSSSQASFDKVTTTVENGGDKLEICRVINGMWQTSGGWGRIDRDKAVDAMLKYADAGFTTFDMADHYGPAEDLYGTFINKVRRERGDEFASSLRGLTKWVPSPTKMTRSWVETNIDRSRKRMDVKTLDMLQFHWWDYGDSGYLDALKHMADLKEEGKIKTLALTNFDTKRLGIILENGIPVVSNQVQHSLVDMRPQQQMSELCQITGVKLITYGTVMGGLLSEKFLDANISIPFAGPALDTPSLNKYKRMVDAWGGWNLFQQLLRTVKSVATKHGVSISTIGVRYILDQPLVEHYMYRMAEHCKIIGKGEITVQWGMLLPPVGKDIRQPDCKASDSMKAHFPQSVGGSMIGVRLGLAEHIRDSQAIFKTQLDDEDRQRIQAVLSKGKNLLQIIGDCGDEYRRA